MFVQFRGVNSKRKDFITFPRTGVITKWPYLPRDHGGVEDGAEEPVRGVRNWVGFPGRETVSLLRDQGAPGHKCLRDQPTNILSSSCLEGGVGVGVGRSGPWPKPLSSKRTYSLTGSKSL